MANYVNQQQYTPFVKPYIAGPTKEYEEQQKRLVADYDEAAMQYDALKEAADNMQSLDAPGDIKLKNEAFADAMSQIDAAAKAGDYENRGRLVRRAIKDFTTKYKPVAEQVKARQEAFDTIDKDDKIIQSEKSELKAIIDENYKKQGLYKDENGNFVGFKARVINAPKTVDLIEKINKAMSGAVTADQKSKLESIVNQPGTLYDKMMMLKEKGVELFPKEQLQTILNQVMNDPEVAGYNNFWASARTRNGTPEEAVAILQNKIDRNAEELVKKFPNDYKGLSKEQLTQKSIENLEANGFNVKDTLEKAADGSIAKQVLMQKYLSDKYNEASNYVNQKYGQVKSYDYVTFSETQHSKNLHDALMPATNVVSDLTPFVDVNGDVSTEANKSVIQSAEVNLAASLAKLTFRTEGVPSEGYVAGTLQRYKPTEAEAKAGITTTDKMMKQLTSLASVKGPKQEEAIEKLAELRPMYAKYQNAVQIEKGAEATLQKTLKEDYTKANKLTQEIKQEVRGKDKDMLPFVMENLDALGDTRTSGKVIEKDNKRYRIILDERDNSVNIHELDADNHTIKRNRFYAPLEKLVASKDIVMKSNSVRRNYYEGLKNNSSLPVVSSVGETQKIANDNEAYLKSVTTPAALDAAKDTWTVVPLVKGALGQPIRLSTFLDGVDISKSNTKAGFVKADVIPDGRGGFTNGIKVTTTAGEFFVPNTQLKFNALTDISNMKNDVAKQAEQLKAMSGDVFKLSGFNGEFINSKTGKKEKANPQDILTFEFDPANRNQMRITKD
jgi:hypothetical protein